MHNNNNTLSFIYILCTNIIYAGIFIMNMAARNKEKRTEILHSLARHFSDVISIPISEDINEVIIGLPYSDLGCVKDQDGSASKTNISLASNQKVKDRLANLAVTVSKNSGGRLNADDLITDWTSLLASSRFVYS